MRLTSSLVGFLLVERTIAASNYSAIDPIKNFCLRIYHQSVVKNNILYIDGGLEASVPVNFNGNPEGDTPILGYNPALISTSMTSSWDWKMNISINAISKTKIASSGTFPPNYVRGALYAGAESDPNLYLYGGTSSFVNTSFPGFFYPIPPLYSLWSYDSSGNSWDRYDTSLNLPYRPAGGAYAEATDHNLGFYLSGFIDQGSDSDYANLTNFRQYMNGLVVVNITSQNAVNISTSSLKDSPRVMGVSHIFHMSAIKISFGSVDFLDISSLDLTNTNSTTGTWYTQATTGAIPEPRADFCVIAVSAPDNSSHNIYLYGGKGESKLFDEVFVLSVPSFTWIKITQGNSPRYGHTCHLVGQSQMITVGGTNSDNLTAWCDWEDRGVAIFDLNKPRGSGWNSVFNATAGEYQVPEAIYSVIGGNSQGNATMSTPAGGFSSEDVSSFFNQQGQGQKGGNHLSGGEIAGAVIGAIAGAAIVAAAVILFIVWRREKHRRTSVEAQAGQQQSHVQTDPLTIHEAPSSTDYGPSQLVRSLFRNPKKKAELPTPLERPAAELEVPVHELEGGMGAFELEEKRRSATSPETDHD